VSQELRDQITATAKWLSLTDGHVLVNASCLRTRRWKKHHSTMTKWGIHLPVV